MKHFLALFPVLLLLSCGLDLTPPTQTVVAESILQSLRPTATAAPTAVPTSTPRPANFNRSWTFCITAECPGPITEHVNAIWGDPNIGQTTHAKQPIHIPYAPGAQWTLAVLYDFTNRIGDSAQFDIVLSDDDGPFFLADFVNNKCWNQKTFHVLQGKGTLHGWVETRDVNYRFAIVELPSNTKISAKLGSRCGTPPRA